MTDYIDMKALQIALDEYEEPELAYQVMRYEDRWIVVIGVVGKIPQFLSEHETEAEAWAQLRQFKLDDDNCSNLCERKYQS